MGVNGAKQLPGDSTSDLHVTQMKDKVVLVRIRAVEIHQYGIFHRIYAVTDRQDLAKIAYVYFRSTLAACVRLRGQ